MRGSTRHILHLLLAVLLGCVLPPGCVAPPAADHEDALRLRFPEQAASVLEGAEAFVARGDGFTTDEGGSVEAALRRRSGLTIALPASADGEVRFHSTGGFEARVREIGASGPGKITERAVAYARDGGTSYWTATEQGYEEWLLLDAGRAKGGEPVVAWEVSGATLRQEGEAVTLHDERGAAQIRVTAPAAYGAGGRKVEARLAARGARIELSVDAGGEVVLVDPLWVWLPTDSMSTGRMYHTATRLDDGRVLVTGGWNGSSYLASTQIYDPATNTWSTKAFMSTPRAHHTATLVSGKVLVTGGITSSTVLSSAELYDPSTDTWSPVASMNASRYDHKATRFLIPFVGFRVLVTGGGPTSSSGPRASAEVYNPTTDTWSPAGWMSTARYNHTALDLGNGKVLVAGGRNADDYLSTAEIYTGANHTWSTAAPMSVARFNHAATRLSSGKLLVVGGSNSSGPQTSAEVYDPSIDDWSPTPSLGAGGDLTTATLLDNGKVLVAGGHASSGYLASAKLYNPTTNTWSSAGAMDNARGSHTATLLANGNVLVAGGYDGSAPLASAEILTFVDVF